jgi:putative addiction module killer protein
VRQVRPFKVREYVEPHGKSPFREWLDSLDIATKARVQVRLLRVESGNLGDYKSIGEGVMELRLDFGPGYRIYFAIDGGTIVLLLTGGNKGGQRKDIKHAQKLWAEYLSGGRDGTKK